MRNNNLETEVNNMEVKGVDNMNKTIVNNKEVKVMNGGIEMNNVKVLVKEVVEGLGVKHITKVLRDEKVIPVVLAKVNVEDTDEVVRVIKKTVAAFNKGIEIEAIKETKEDIKADIMDDVYREMNIDIYEGMSPVLRKMRTNGKIRKQVETIITISEILKNKKVNELTEKEFGYLMANMVEGEQKNKIAAEYITIHRTKSFIKQGALEGFTKAIKVYLKNRIEMDIEKSKYDGSEKLIKRVMVEPSQESELIRTLNTYEGVMADEIMTLEGTCIDEICSISLSSNLGNNKTLMKEVFARIIGNHRSGEKVYVLFLESGLSMVEFATEETIIEMVKQEKNIKYAIEYSFLGITPSGLRTRAITLAAINRINKEGEVTNVDRRIEILNKASNGAFIENFMYTLENGKLEFKHFNSSVKLFKAMSRIMMVATPSKRIGQVKSYIVLDNLAAGACFDKNNYFEPLTMTNPVTSEDDLNKPEVIAEIASLKANGKDPIFCYNTKDGTCFISSDFIQEELKKNNVPTSTRELLGVCLQARGGGLKNSSQIMSKKNISTLLMVLLERGAKISRIVINGEDKDINTLTDEDIITYSKDLDGLFDENCMKLVKHDTVFDLVCLKKAHQSNTGLNMVINIMMLMQNDEKAIKVIEQKVKKTIMRKFDEAGVYIELADNGNIKNVSIDNEKFIRYNNDTQTANWMFKSAPKQILACLPGIVKSILTNIVTSTANMLNILKAEVDAEYCVIQADIAPLFGVRMLDDNECYCKSFEEEEIKAVSAARHPISGLKSISTFSVISASELINRIQKMNVSNLTKKFLEEYVIDMDSFVLIPACHFLMEKHDGMDFDIDSMQFFKDPDVVDIMKDIADFGIIIDRSKDENDPIDGDISHNESNQSKNISQFKNGNISKITRENNNVVSFASNDFGLDTNIFGIENSCIGNIDMKELEEDRTSNLIKNDDGSYTITFENTANLVLDYFLSPIAPVGFISTGFYNNALLLLVLKSKKTPLAIKENISYVFRKYYQCEELKEYISPITSDKSYKTYKLRNGKERTQVNLCKRTCEEVILRYVESFGSIEETIAFLEDCCFCNRYPGETSIDAAKNKYQIIDMFNHKDVIKALGSDKNMITTTIENEEVNNKLFLDNISILNSMIKGKYTNNNFFNLHLINNVVKAEDYFVINDKLTKDEINDKLAKDEVPVVKDILGTIRERMVAYANMAIVMISKELEIKIMSKESDVIRQAIKGTNYDLIANDYRFNTEKVFGFMMNMFINISSSLESINEFEDNDKYITAKKYMKEEAMTILKNYADISFMSSSVPLTKEQIGCAVLSYSISKFEEEVLANNKCRTLNSNLIKIFEEEVLAFFNSVDVNIIAAERIKYATDGTKIAKLKDLVGQTVTASNGKGTNDEENIFFTFDNKKASFENGEIITDSNGAFFCSVNRNFIKSNHEKGIYLPIRSLELLDGQLSYDHSNGFAFVKEELDAFGNKQSNILYGIGKDGSVTKICTLLLNYYLSSLMEKLDLSTATIKLFKSGTGYALYLNCNDLFSIAEEEASSLNTNDNVSDLFGMNIAMPEDSVQSPIENNVTDIQKNITTPSIAMPVVEKEAAISSDSSFSTPSFDFGGESYSDYDEPSWF